MSDAVVYSSIPRIHVTDTVVVIPLTISFLVYHAIAMSFYADEITSLAFLLTHYLEIVFY